VESREEGLPWSLLEDCYLCGILAGQPALLALTVVGIGTASLEQSRVVYKYDGIGFGFTSLHHHGHATVGIITTYSLDYLRVLIPTGTGMKLYDHFR
jgi:hypothetical protein